MGRIAKIGPTERGEPQEWSAATTRANQVRERVAGQVGAHLLERNENGSPEYVALRVRHYAAARRSGDPFVIRAALMDLAAAAGAAIVAIDMVVKDPETTVLRRNGNGHRPC